MLRERIRELLGQGLAPRAALAVLLIEEAGGFMAPEQLAEALHCSVRSAWAYIAVYRRLQKPAQDRTVDSSGDSDVARNHSVQLPADAPPLLSWFLGSYATEAWHIARWEGRTDLLAVLEAARRTRHYRPRNVLGYFRTVLRNYGRPRPQLPSIDPTLLPWRRLLCA